jgi:serine-type D-Ala-D-Ala carboxypeptidase (penicillin-binding protein 5/6)
MTMRCCSAESCSRSAALRGPVSQLVSHGTLTHFRRSVPVSTPLCGQLGRTPTWTAFILAVWALCCGEWPAAFGNPPVPDPLPMVSAKLADALTPLIRQHEGDVAIAVRHLKHGVEYRHQADVPMPTASLIKFPIMLAVYDQVAQGKLTLEQPLLYRAEDKVPGSGILGPHFTPGLSLPVRDGIRLMMAYSDNVATNLLLGAIGIPTTNDLMDRWQCPHTRIHAQVFRPDSSIAPERSREFGLGSTTADEMISLLMRLQHGELINAEVTQRCREHLLACDDRDRLAKRLPANLKVLLKTGSVSAARTVAGIVEAPSGPFAICILTRNNKDQSWTRDNAAEVLSAELTFKAFEVFESAFATPVAPPSTEPLAEGATGELVQDLQRTLNARTNPSVNLTVDGEFGPVTSAAVRTFQQQAGLETSGRVDRATWSALGPLHPAAGPLVNLEEYNRVVPPGEPAETIDAQPLVTAKAWLVADAATGTVAASHGLDEPRDFASTTKSMTAYVVLKLAQSQPDVLEEVVTISMSADNTPGSTADVRAGEQLTVRELLLGLMLPSGNDAAAMLAEHFGPRLSAASSSVVPGSGAATVSPPAASHGSTPAVGAEAERQFVAAMNRTAAELGMTSTKYQNPHGLTHTEHKSTVHDQLRLARAALLIPEFRDLVRVRQFATVVTGSSGYMRIVAWKNTNRLLDIPGYQGIKTGTTEAAGACLVSLSSHQGREAIVVVLGSTSSDARYIDTRNLFRWYWQQPAATSAPASR